MRYLLGLVVVLTGCGGSTPTTRQQTPIAECKAGPAIVHVAYVPPRPGEKLHYEQAATYDYEVGKGPIKGSTNFVTDETVESVEGDVIESLDVAVATGMYQPDDTKPVVDVKGKRYRARLQGEDTIFFEGDARVPVDIEDVLQTYAREDVGRPHYLVRLLTDATYKQDEQVHLNEDSALGSKGSPADARITLRKLDGDRATFDFEIREPVENAPMLERGQAVFDTSRARLISVDRVATLDNSDPAVRASGFHVNVTIKERYDYGASTADARPPACDPRTTLHIPWNPPRVGETFAFEQKLVSDWTFKNPKTKATARVKGGWETATDERVLEVANGVITALEADVRKDIVRPIAAVAADEASPAPISKSGDKLEIRWQLPKLVFKRNGIEVDPTKDVLTQVLYRADVPLRLWVTRLVTERTFELGVESHYPNEQIIALNDQPCDVRIMLSSMSDGVAQFRLTIKTKIPVGTDASVDMFMRGKLDFDIKRARPLSLSLAGDFDLANGLEQDGIYTLDYKFRYAN